jgi:hypothetical protein
MSDIHEIDPEVRGSPEPKPKPELSNAERIALLKRRRDELTELTELHALEREVHELQSNIESGNVLSRQLTPHPFDLED